MNARLDKLDDTAREADVRSKSASNRLDDLCDRVEKIDEHFDGEIRMVNARIAKEIAAFDEQLTKQALKREQDRRWLLGTVLTSGALAVGVITLIFRTVGM